MPSGAVPDPTLLVGTLSGLLPPADGLGFALGLGVGEGAVDAPGVGVVAGVTAGLPGLVWFDAGCEFPPTMLLIVVPEPDLPVTTASSGFPRRMLRIGPGCSLRPMIGVDSASAAADKAPER